MTVATLDGQTQLVGILGWPVAHSLSPTMHNAAFAYAGLNWRYVPLPVQPGHNLDAALKGLVALGFRGANITVPYKVDAIPLLDSITEAVTIVGAVNTIRIDHNTGKIEGMNTDMTGFLADLAQNRVSMGKNTRALILGAGGAARAIAAGLVRSGAHVTIVNRTVTKAEAIVGFIRSSWANPDINAVSMEDLSMVAWDANLIVNATPVGMWPDTETSPWPERVPFPPGAVVYDSIYRPLKTKLMRQAEAAGLRAVGGLGMLVYQGASAYEVWTGKKAPVDVMKLVCQQALMEDSRPGPF
ncbi:MAG TPA: shikimate dehydrogenase [Aggregatilineales bacterium]|nr:shikimate dehydrogenase [Aggregatilineales bacterium]